MKITAGTETSIIVVVTKTDTDRTPLELINNLSPNKQTNKGILLTQKTVIMGELHHTLKMCPCYAKCSIIISIKLLLSHDFLRSIVETTTDLIVMLILKCGTSRAGSVSHTKILRVWQSFYKTQKVIEISSTITSSRIS